MTAIPFRLYVNNHATADGASLTVSSAVSDFPGANVIDERRWKRHRTQGRFKITSANKKLYINDGSDKTITLTEGEYTSGAALASHIQTQLNASSSNWTCSYGTSTTGRFSFGRSSGTAILKLTTTTDSVADTVGWTAATDQNVGIGAVGQARRNHTSETWRFDLGVARDVTGFIAIPPSDDVYAPSASATLTLKASTTGFVTFAETWSLTRTDRGVFKHFESAETYRYWEFEVVDRENPGVTNADGDVILNGQYLDHAQMFLGEHAGPTTRTVGLGFDRRLVDPSDVTRTEGGAVFTRLRTKYWEIGGVTLDWLTQAERLDLEAAVAEVGVAVPFFLALDPGAEVSEDGGEFTKYVMLEGSPSFRHQRWQYHGHTYSFREVC